MPVKACRQDGKPGWKWGDSGKCYTYASGDDTASKRAKQKAYIQGFAATGGKMEESVLEQFEPPDAGDAPKEVKDILKGTYNSCRGAWVKAHPGDRENAANKQSCSRIAWSAVKKSGWKKDDSGKWRKKS